MTVRYLLCGLLLAASGSQAEPLQHELLVFGSAQQAQTQGYADSKENGDGLLLSADILFSLERNHFKVFGEYLLTNREGDLERFQLGWEPTSDTVVWLGRYHQPGSVYNHEHHHGRYLQTTITRPASEDWEDDGGIIPQHYFGALIETTWHLPAGRALTTAFGGGLAPILTPTGLEPVDLIHPNDIGQHRFGFQARIALLADELGDTGAGLLFAKGRINVGSEEPATLPDLKYVDQTVFGGYVNYTHEPWKLAAVGYHVHAVDVRSNSPGAISNFLVAYVQGERELPQGLHVFARQEFSANSAEPYMELFPQFATQRLSLGMRWDFIRRQALTLQVSDAHTRSNSFGEFRLQWSAALL